MPVTPMPGISSTAPRYENWDMDHLDHYQHYFYDDHDPDEDFFKSTAPSEDIWKKFELVPTPPMSPIRAVEGPGRVGLLCPSLGDKLELVSQFLGQEDEQQQQHHQPHQELPCRLTLANDNFNNLSSIIIQDCMWSGFSAGQQLERVVADRCASCPGTGVAAAAKLAAGSAVTSPGRAASAATDATGLSGVAVDCVDPAAVLAFPMSGYKKQVFSGSESHTDSSDDEDDKDDDEEEIDVVTVEHSQQRKPRRFVNTRKPVTITVRADPLDPGTKRFHISIHQQQHNYAAPSPDTLPTPPEPARKRVRQEVSPHTVQPQQNFQNHQPRPGHAPLNLDSRVRSESPTLSALSPTSSSSPSSPSSSSHSCSHSPPLKSLSHHSSPQSSDCEDSDKRKAHNFLERKRRNDLRSRFLSLRDEIPGLADCPKTPKVAILTGAMEYLQQLHASERQKAQERKQLKARRLQLLQRLALLKQS
ncbi:protein L-Myc-1b [Gouania willdenowi]|uniref:Protein L-Myc-1b-like n=1 Tax=Gouania willdenowi TaxID=441366 RepID=A0A8C5EL78_GOUWI|nr:protein L-Myc-1b-like [Gouania willdenowi]